MQKVSTILLVDDDNINNFLNERLIKKLAVADNIKVTTNGAEGFRYVKENCRDENPYCPQIIFLDLNMPVMDGFEFIKAFESLSLDTKTRIVILTTSQNPKDIHKIEALGKFDFINKPLTQEKIINCLSSIN